MDIDVLRAQLERKITAADEEIRGREAQIEALKRENEEAIARIKDAREALAMLAQVGEKIGALGPLEEEAEAAGGKRVQQKKIVDPFIEVAGLEGITFEEIMARASQSHGVALKPASLKSYLSKMKAEGVYEQRSDGRWRLARSASKAAAESGRLAKQRMMVLEIVTSHTSTSFGPRSFVLKRVVEKNWPPPHPLVPAPLS